MTMRAPIIEIRDAADAAEDTLKGPFCIPNGLDIVRSAVIIHKCVR